MIKKCTVQFTVEFPWLTGLKTRITTFKPREGAIVFLYHTPPSCVVKINRQVTKHVCDVIVNTPNVYTPSSGTQYGFWFKVDATLQQVRKASEFNTTVVGDTVVCFLNCILSSVTSYACVFCCVLWLLSLWGFRGLMTVMIDVCFWCSGVSDQQSVGSSPGRGTHVFEQNILP